MREGGEEEEDKDVCAARGLKDVGIRGVFAAPVTVADGDGVALCGGGAAEAAAGGLFCGAGSVALLILTVPQRSRQ